MAVVDPNVSEFNYAALLKDAVSPLDVYGAGQLAQAQQRGERMFQMQRDQRQSDMALQRELASERARASFQNDNELNRLREAERLRSDQEEKIFQRGKSETANQKIAQAQRIDPNFTPNPKLSPEEQEAQTDHVIHGAVVGDYVAAEKRRRALSKQRDALIDKLGGNIPVDERQVSTIIANDPTLIGKLTDTERQALLDGAATADDIAKKWWFTKNKALILTAAQTARAQLQDRQRQVAQLKAGTEGQELQSRYDEANSEKASLASKLEPGQILAAHKLLGDEDAPVAPVKTLDKLGLLPPPAPPGGTPPPSAPTDFKKDPNYYSALATLHQAQAETPGIDSQLSDLQKQLDEGGTTTYTPSTGGSGFSTFTPRFQSHSVEKMGELATRLLKVQKAKESNDLALRTAMDKVKALNPDFGKPVAPAAFPARPAATPPPDDGGLTFDAPPNAPPSQPRFDPSEMFGLKRPPASFMPLPPTGTPQPPQLQPQFQPPPAAPMPAPNGPAQTQDPAAALQQQTFFNKVYQVLGTNDHSVLGKASNWLQQSQGLNQQQIGDLLKSAVAGDATAQRRLKLAVQSVQGQSSLFSPPPPDNAPQQP